MRQKYTYTVEVNKKTGKVDRMVNTKKVWVPDPNDKTNEFQTINQFWRHDLTKDSTK